MSKEQYVLEQHPFDLLAGLALVISGLVSVDASLPVGRSAAACSSVYGCPLSTGAFVLSS